MEEKISNKFRKENLVVEESYRNYAKRQLCSKFRDSFPKKKELNQAYMDKEQYRKQKSRNNWLKAGDRNTQYFHGTTKVRKAQNCIMIIRDNHGIVHCRDEAIDEVEQEYFQEMFTT